jgi:hypothetical protein
LGADVSGDGGERHPAVFGGGVTPFGPGSRAEVVEVDGYYRARLDAVRSLDLHMSTLAASRGRIVAAGVATDAAVDDLLAEIKAAMAKDHTWSGSPFFLDLVVRTSG